MGGNKELEDLFRLNKYDEKKVKEVLNQFYKDIKRNMQEASKQLGHIEEKELTNLHHKLDHIITWTSIVLTKETSKENEYAKTAWLKIAKDFKEKIKQYNVGDKRTFRFLSLGMCIGLAFNKFKAIDKRQQNASI